MGLLNKNRELGQGLIEAMVALGVAVIVVSTIAVAVITAVNNSDFSRNQNSATTYAQQGLEVAKNKAQNDWSTFSTYSGDYCLDKESTGFTSVVNGNCGIIDNLFMRKIKITQQDNASCGTSAGNAIGTKINSYVVWSDGKCSDPNNKYCHNVSLDTCVFNYVIPTPGTNP